MEREKLNSLLVSPDKTIKQAMQILTLTSEKILFVVDSKEKLLGTLTDGDIRSGLINGLDFSETIDKVMNIEFISLGIDEPGMREKARTRMVENKIEQVPVIDEKGKIIDIFLWTDILGEKRVSKPAKLLGNQVVIMAGGKGTRLDPFTKILPKPLIPVGNRAIIELIMEKFYFSGFHRFIYTLNYKKEYIKLFLKENSLPYDISWIDEDEFLGTAGGLSLLRDKIADTFFVTNCDSLISVDFNDVLNWHKNHKAMMTVVGCHNEVRIPFGVLQFSNGKLERIMEKPVHDVIINTGVYVIEPHVLSMIPEGQHMDMNQLIDKAAQEGVVAVYPIYDGWLDIGQWEEYRKSLEKMGDIKEY
ncbi:MAG: CBS domain-containing protein [Nitrospirae bacterium]|nr:MAG: CBS domain-containing protein [Nitrospirota bacterium]